MRVPALAELAVAASRVGVDDEACVELAEQIRLGLQDELVGSATDVYLAALQPLEGASLTPEQAKEMSTAVFALLNASRPPGKRRRTEGTSLSGEAAKRAHRPQPASSEVASMLKRMAWKREYKSDQERFCDDYLHELQLPDAIQRRLPTIQLRLHQRPFKETGFASTVWDSSIVLSRALERWARSNEVPAVASALRGHHTVELGAGCGLVGITAAVLGARVTLTDLPCNVALLAKNVEANEAVLHVAPCPLAVRGLDWTAPLPANIVQGAELILATDVFYSGCPVEALIKTVQALATPSTQVVIAVGRNRAKLNDFIDGMMADWCVRAVNKELQLDADYQCDDCDLWTLSKKQGLK